MDNAIVTAASVAALVLAAWIVVRGRGRRFDVAPWVIEGQAPQRSALVAGMLRTACIGITAGAVSGVLVGGFGARLMMRIMAATSGDRAQGLLTQADERVGRISVGGTLAILVFVGLLTGIGGGLVFVLVRRWLPRRPWQAGALFGLLGLLLLAPGDPLDPSNRDFLILRPVPLAVALIVMLFVAGGVTLAVVAAGLDHSYPLLDTPRHVPAYLPLVILLVPVLLVPALLLLVVALTASASAAVRRVWRSRAVDRVGYVALGVAGAALAVPFVDAVAEIVG